jgi:hypothetical protein
MLKKLINMLILGLRFEGERESYPETFREELNYQCGRVLNFACLITFGWLPYIPIDMALHPGQPVIVVLRICYPVLGVTLLLLRTREYFRLRSLYLLVTYGAYMAVATAVLTGLTGGDPAYIGGYIFIITLLALAPVKKRHAYAILVVSLVAFFSVGIASGMRFDNPRARYSLNDVMAAAVVSAMFTFILDSIRYMSWKKSKTIERNRGVIIQQKDQLETQINLAGELQKKLLPLRLPEVENATVVFSYHPMMEVGGDFVDIHYSWDQKGLGLFICDVSGHGVAAAFIASMVKMALAGWNEHLESPAVMLKNVYNSLTGKMGTHFVTAAICYINLETGLLRIAAAGHPPVMVVRSGGGIEFFKPAGRIINDLMPPNFEVAETVLGRNDKVILYTDGITECFDEDRRMFGEERFIGLVAANRSLPPAGLCESIMKTLGGFVGKESFKDDITLLVTEFTADAAVEAPVLEETPV